jgi:hypothetical protein
MNVNWIFQLEEEKLKAELKVYGLRATGVREDLAIRLWHYMRAHPEEFISPVTPLEPLDVGRESNRHFPLDMIRKWNLKFTSEEDSVHSFLEQLDELKQAYKVEDADMLAAIPEVLKGQAVLWFRNNKDSWNSSGPLNFVIFLWT